MPDPAADPAAVAAGPPAGAPAGDPAGASEPPAGAPADAAVVELLGVLAYAELTAFQRLVEDFRLAPALADKMALGEMAVAEFGHFGRLRSRLAELGVDPEAAMAPFVAALDAFHDSTLPGDWLESLVKAYVGDGIAADFYREVARFVDEPTRELVLEVLADTGHAAFVVERVRAAVAAEPFLAGRLALWARRLVGEAMVQAQRVAVDREPLARLIAADADDLAAVGRLLTRISSAHAGRMAELGLSN